MVRWVLTFPRPLECCVVTRWRGILKYLLKCEKWLMRKRRGLTHTNELSGGSAFVGGGTIKGCGSFTGSFSGCFNSSHFQAQRFWDSWRKMSPRVFGCWDLVWSFKDKAVLLVALLRKHLRRCHRSNTSWGIQSEEDSTQLLILIRFVITIHLLKDFIFRNGFSLIFTFFCVVHLLSLSHTHTHKPKRTVPHCKLLTYLCNTKTQNTQACCWVT